MGDLLKLDTVRALAASKDEADLVKLCEVLLSGDVNDMKAFHDKNKKLFERHDFSFQDVMGKIKLLTLATMALGRSEIPLAEVAKKLEEPEEGVEQWVVRAISENLIDGRIDQLRQTVLIKTVFQRKFEKEEWAFLDNKVTCWIDNLESVIKFIGEQQAT